MTPLEKIKKACIAANPEIMELKFGCRLLIPKDESDEICEKDSLVVCVNEPQKDKGREFLDTIVLTPIKERGWAAQLRSRDIERAQVLGRPIQLADVLMAIKHQHANATGSFVDPCHDIGWDFTKDLDHQSPETLSFIADLLPDQTEE